MMDFALLINKIQGKNLCKDEFILSLNFKIYIRAKIKEENACGSKYDQTKVFFNTLKTK